VSLINQIRLYECEVIDEPSVYAYISTSSKTIRVTARTKVMFAIEGKSLYIIDENGESHETTYVRKEPLPPPPPVVF